MTAYEDTVELAKRRGFFWPSFSLYGGISGFYDYGPLGVLMRDNIVKVWKESYLADGAIFIDTPVVVPSPVFRASGHLDKFSDLGTECQKCHNREKLETVMKASGFDQALKSVQAANEFLSKNTVKCVSCGNRITEARDFQVMFSLPGQGGGTDLYLRPETAQGIIVNFKLLNTVFRGKLPMAVAQFGKGFRNEISPRQSLIRLREFNMAEVEVFVDPQRKFWKDFKATLPLSLIPRVGEQTRTDVSSALSNGIISSNALAYFMEKTAVILCRVGINPSKLRFRQVSKDDLAHYSVDTWDVEVEIDNDWVEVTGIADRNDLPNHEKSSGESMSILSDDKPVVPSIIEPASGIDRILLSVLMHTYYRRPNGFKVLRLPPEIAPYNAAILPLVNKDNVNVVALEFFNRIISSNPYVAYDQSGSIGRRYARQDETGTPYCITFDYNTLSDATVTVRERDSAEQVRVHSEKLMAESRNLLQYLESLFKMK
ncbi:MAG: glycine--tRNA ligase [Thermoplasmataceae archaeon]